VPFASSQDRRNDDRAGVYWATFERVVEVLSMRGSAVDESRAGGTQSAGMADGGARAFVVAPGERGLDVILATRRDAKAGYVDQQVFAFLAHGFRQPVGALHGNMLR
jgi:hypothetical protein